MVLVVTQFNLLKGLEKLASQYSSLEFAAHLRSFKNIKLLFSTPIHTNVELVGSMKTFGKRLHTGLRRHSFPQSAGPCNIMFRSFCRPFSWKGFKSFAKVLSSISIFAKIS